MSTGNKKYYDNPIYEWSSMMNAMFIYWISYNSIHLSYEYSHEIQHQREHDQTIALWEFSEDFEENKRAIGP